VNESQDNEIETIQKKYEGLSDCLTEKSRRIWAATEAASQGWGGITIVNQATGIDYKTIRKGLADLKNKKGGTSNRVRCKGGGRKKLSEVVPDLDKDIELLIEPATRGDPESPLRWTCKSTYKLANALQQKGYKICQKTGHKGSLV